MNYSWLKTSLLGHVLAIVILALLLVILGSVVRPDTSPAALARQDMARDSTKPVEEARELRAQKIDPAHPVVLNKTVNYAEGERAAWFPKEEAPLLADLVKAGKLPPLRERLPSEPCVMEGVDGPGKYGGTWIRLVSSPGDVSVNMIRLNAALLFRWSPQGYPVVPHLAKGCAVSEDNRTFTVELRKGMKWSDGHPFTADDIMYWWEKECNEPLIMSQPPPFMQVRGKSGRVEKVDETHVRFVFPYPNGSFLYRLADNAAAPLTSTPAHYFRKFHPVIGDKALIEAYMRGRNIPSPVSAYRMLQTNMNPDLPTLGPWMLRTYKANPPLTYVRNPYYGVVDSKGRQLPNIDRVLCEVKTPDLIEISVANGEATMQDRYLRYDQYTHLMGQREKGEYALRHWFSGDRGQYLISVNQNLRVDAKSPDSARRAELLKNKRFRQALSLAIRRDDIIRAEYNGQCEPAQIAPGPVSFFHEPSVYKLFTEYDPSRANRLLDEIGLNKRDAEGFRTFPGGERMSFYLNYTDYTGMGPAQFVVDDWERVGVRVIPRSRSRGLFWVEKAGLDQDFTVWGGNGEFMPLLSPRFFVPSNDESNFAIGNARWYMQGGLYGNPLADAAHGCEVPPVGSDLRRVMEIYDRALAESDAGRQKEIFSEAIRIASENVWNINICTSPPVLAAVKNGLRNVPGLAVSSWIFLTPGNCGPETFFFDNPSDSPGALAQMREEILDSTLAPGMPSATKFTAALSGDRATTAALSAAATGGASGGKASGGKRSASILGRLLRYSFLALALLIAAAAMGRHPFLRRRLLIMIPTLLVISVITFVIIQLPPGDFITSKILQLQSTGDAADLRQIGEIREVFHLDEPAASRYLRWMGFRWFLSFRDEDAGLLQGDMGRSMESMRPVNEIFGDEIILTVLLSLGTVLFTWCMAIPIGIYSAVRQYTLADYLLTFLGFIGMCVPGFLLALLLMFASAEWLGIPVSGLFSSQYGAQPEWTWGKVVDLLKHIWVPVVVLGVGGTASMIRVMRANLLDELRKPYVVTARAKGVRPFRLLMKYPVRMALNPFISGIGGLFPQLVSGGAIVSMVLSLPTVGPVMLAALLSEDTYLAGSMLMVMSVLGVVGTLVSDLLLLWVDPRIRFQGGGR